MHTVAVISLQYSPMERTTKPAAVQVWAIKFRFITLHFAIDASIYNQTKYKRLRLPLMPTEGPPAATAARAYSICTNLPDGLKKKTPHVIGYAHVLTVLVI